MKFLIWKIKYYSFFGLVIFFLTLIIGCIEEFNPELNDYDNLLVVNGSIIKGDSLQKVVLSRSAPLDNPIYIPVTDCRVIVSKENGQMYYFDETSEGIYTVAIPPQDLQFNDRLKLHITTPDSNEYESDYEQIFESSPVDAVYYLNEAYQSSSSYSAEGLQYYVDLKAPNSSTKNYRWTFEETWEYHSMYIIEAYYDAAFGTVIEIEFPSDSNKICWSTQTVHGLFSSTTKNLTVNEKKKIPLNYIAGVSEKLTYKYSLLVKQYALSDAAYLYWDKNRVETQESGGLYQSQPSQSTSNIRNVNKPDEIVLGFFWASSYTEKRVFFDGPFMLVERAEKCKLNPLILDDPEVSIPNTPIIWLADMGSGIWGYADAFCFDCTLRGGTIKKPDFWD